MKASSSFHAPARCCTGSRRADVDGEFRPRGRVRVRRAETDPLHGAIERFEGTR